MSLSVQMRSPKIIVNDDAGVIARGLELLVQFGASPSDRDRAETAALQSEEQAALSEAAADLAAAAVVEANAVVAAAVVEATGEANAAALTAEGFATDADAARILAESARDASFTNAVVYPDIATGRAAVADGAQFTVVASGATEAVRYVRDSSSTQTELARYPGTRGLTPARNIALDPVDAAGTGVVQGAGTLQAAVTAPADMIAVGILKARPFGTGATATAVYHRDQLEALPNGKYLYHGAYVYSTNGSSWQASAMKAYLFAVASGGSITATLTALETGFTQITANLRFYWGRFQVPASGTFVSVAYGFDNVVSGTVAFVGGWCMAQSQNGLPNGTVRIDDWLGWSTRDTWRTATDVLTAQVPNKAEASALNAIASSTLRNTTYRNLIPNPNLDASEAAPSYSGSVNLSTPPKSLAMQARGILSAIRVGTGGTHQFKRNVILTASSSGKFWFASVYVWSSTGSNWPNVAAYYYSTGTVYVGVLANLTSFVQIDANTRLYYGTGQMPVRSDLTEIRIGQTSLQSGYECEVSGFDYVENETAIGLNDVQRDDWYPQFTSQPGLVAAARLASQGGALPFSGQTIAYFGDSIVESYGVPAALQALTGGTVLNFGFGGCRWCAGGSSAQDLIVANMSMVRIAEMILSGDFTDLITAADDLFALNGNDDRSQAAAIAALDWSTVDVVLMDYGTNDWSAQKPLGATSSATDTELHGAINLSVSRLLTAYPTMQLAMVTPVWRGPLATLGDSNINPNGAGVFLSAFQNAIIERGRYHQVPVMRMHEVAGVNLANKSTYMSDDLHPTQPVGRDRKARLLAKWMRSTLA